MIYYKKIEVGRFVDEKKMLLLCAAGFVLLQLMRVSAMSSCCDHKGLEAAAVRYAMSAANKERIDPNGIKRDLNFLSPEAVKSEEFSRYLKKEAFSDIERLAVSDNQKLVICCFHQAEGYVEDDDLERVQLYVLLETVVKKLRPEISIDIKTHPGLEALGASPSFKLSKMLLPSFIGGPM